MKLEKWTFSLWSFSDIKQLFSPFVFIVLKTLLLRKTCFPAALIFLLTLLLAFFYVEVIESFSILYYSSLVKRYMFAILYAYVIVLFDIFILFKSCCSLSWKWFPTFLKLMFLTNKINSFSKGVSSFTFLGVEINQRKKEKKRKNKNIDISS